MPKAKIFQGNSLQEWFSRHHW